MNIEDEKKAIEIIKHNLSIYKNTEDYTRFLKSYHTYLIYEHYLLLIKEELKK